MVMENAMELVLAFTATYGLKVIGAILILIAGRIIAGVVRSGVNRELTRRKTDPSLTNFVASLAYALVIIFAIVAAVAKFDVETASFVAILGAASFAIGFALQGSLANFASGVMLLLFRPFKIGDFVEAAGVAGTIEDIQLFNTVLATPDNVRVTVPNGKMYGDTIKNYSANDTRRVDLVCGIGYGSSIEQAIEVTLGLIQAEPRILAEPAPTVAVAELADSSVNLVVRPWVKGTDYWAVRFDLTRAIKEAFDQNGIEIPFPQRVVHQLNEPAAV
jgi:small conductance mechanosensitive channel